MASAHVVLGSSAGDPAEVRALCEHIVARASQFDAGAIASG